MSTVEEKLLKFQFVCEDKLRKIELLKQTYEKNEKILESYGDNYEQQTELAQLSNTLAEIKYKSAKAREESQFELKRQKLQRQRRDELQAELDEAVHATDQLTQDIPAMKGRMESRIAELTDLFTSLRETHCMAEEEARSVAVLIQDAAKRSKDDQQIEWLEKLVTATRIQSQDAQRRLAAL